MQKRLPSVDTLRALAILLMILYHGAYDLKEFAQITIDYHSPLWFSIGKVSALLFIILSGFSAGLSKNSPRHGLEVLAWGGIITLITYILMPNDYVRFGILQLLGIGMLLSPYLLRLSPLALLLIATGIGIGGYWALNTTIPYVWFLPFGLTYSGYHSIDYYPLFPYFSATILGILFFKYYQGSMKKCKPASGYENKAPVEPSRFARCIESLSKHSLGIYLIHQPLLVGAIFLFTHPAGGSQMLTLPLILSEFRIAFDLLAVIGIVLVLAAAFFVGYKRLIER